MELENGLQQGETKEIKYQESLKENETPMETPDSGIFSKDFLISEILSEAKKREELVAENQILQHKLAQSAKWSAKEDDLEYQSEASEEYFELLIGEIEEKSSDIKAVENNTKEKITSLKCSIQAKDVQLKSLKASFFDLKKKTALKSVNCDTGKKYTTQDIDELLKKEDKIQTVLENLQFESIKARDSLESVLEERKNLVEGPLDYGEYEVMRITTENNKEATNEIRREIEKMSSKACHIINTLSHMNQKLYFIQDERQTFTSEENLLDKELNEMRDDLNKEKSQLAKKNKQNEELQRRHLMLQYPDLLSDFKALKAQNEKIKESIAKMKQNYKTSMDFLSPG